MRIASFSRFVTMLLPLAAHAQTPPPAEAANLRSFATGAYRAFDFWVGDSVVRHGSGQKVGRNSIQPEQRALRSSSAGPARMAAPA